MTLIPEKLRIFVISITCPVIGNSLITWLADNELLSVLFCVYFTKCFGFNESSACPKQVVLGVEWLTLTKSNSILRIVINIIQFLFNPCLLMLINPFPHTEAFWCLCSRRLFENIVTKEECSKQAFSPFATMCSTFSHRLLWIHSIIEIFYFLTKYVQSSLLQNYHVRGRVKNQI